MLVFGWICRWKLVRVVVLFRCGLIMMIECVGFLVMVLSSMWVWVKLWDC